jgi:hypothetical protein
VRRWVPRYNFYLQKAYDGRRGVARAIVRQAARLRVRRDFYAYDVERRAVDLFKRLRTGTARQQPNIAED